MKNKISITLIFILLTAFITPFVGFSMEKKTIAILKSRDIAPYNAAVEGFKNLLTEKGINAKIVDFDINKEEIIDDIKSKSPDIILTLGTRATEIVYKKISEIPIVFSVVLDPKEIGLVANNLTGASLDIPLEVQFKNFKKIVSGLKRVGVIYTHEENYHIIRKAKQTARNIDINIITYPIKTIKEITKIKFNELDLDVLWLIPDMTVCQPSIIKYILKNCLKNKIAVMGISPAYVRAGALIAHSCDYEDIGRQTAEIALKILKGENPKNIPISKPRKTKLYLNLAVADRLGIEIPEKIIENAEEIFGK